MTTQNMFTSQTRLPIRLTKLTQGRLRCASRRVGRYSYPKLNSSAKFEPTKSTINRAIILAHQSLKDRHFAPKSCLLLNLPLGPFSPPAPALPKQNKIRIFSHYHAREEPTKSYL